MTRSTFCCDKQLKIRPSCWSTRSHRRLLLYFGFDESPPGSSGLLLSVPPPHLCLAALPLHLVHLSVPPKRGP